MPILGRLLLAALCLIPIARAQKEPPNVQEYMTGGKFNGRYWNAVATEDSKETLIIGLRDGVEVARRATDPKCWDQLKVLYPTGFTSHDVLDAMNHLYADPANLNLPLVDAYYLTVARMSGVDASVIEKETLKRRAEANGLHSR